MSDRDTKNAIHAVRELSAYSRSLAKSLPEPDVDAIMPEPAVSHVLVSRIVRAGFAAAILAAALLALLFAQPQTTPEGPVPQHLTQLVESLYADSDTGHDDLSDLMWSVTDNGDSYLDDVWDRVISGIENL